jgi:UTP--glucose-1-phosphate uridylyltransferase
MISSYGVISGSPVQYNGRGDQLFQVKDLVEKPPAEKAPSNLAIIGRYILEPEIFGALESTTPGAGGEIQLTDGLRALLRNRPIFGWRFDGKRYDAGDKLGFLTATVEFALRNPEFGEAFRQYLKNLQMD